MRLEPVSSEDDGGHSALLKGASKRRETDTWPIKPGVLQTIMILSESGHFTGLARSYQLLPSMDNNQIIRFPQLHVFLLTCLSRKPAVFRIRKAV